MCVLFIITDQQLQLGQLVYTQKDHLLQYVSKHHALRYPYCILDRELCHIMWNIAT
jgi:hypothetical protein